MRLNFTTGKIGKIGFVLTLAVLPLTIASPLVVYERPEVSSVAGSSLLREAGEAATAGPEGPM